MQNILHFRPALGSHFLERYNKIVRSIINGAKIKLMLKRHFFRKRRSFKRKEERDAVLVFI